MSDAPKDPTKGFLFRLEIDGIEAASFEKCETVEIAKVTEADPDAEVRDWMRGTFDTSPIVMRRAQVIPPSDEARAAYESSLQRLLAESRVLTQEPADDVRMYVVRAHLGTGGRPPFLDISVRAPTDDADTPPENGGSGGETW